MKEQLKMEVGYIKQSVQFKGGLTPPMLNAHAYMDPIAMQLFLLLFVGTLRYWT